MAEVDVKDNRPLSPHLQIYKPIFTMMMSIVHRITGAALYFGTVLVAWWLISVAVGGGYYTFAAIVFDSIFGRLILFGYTWALMHHMLGGVRHFIWDFGYALGPGDRDWISKATLAGSIGLTALIWLIGLLAI
ncbi:MAG: succinate dehydrogenase, cytochrome b556 subunit [Pseudomonadota bacterium]